MSEKYESLRDDSKLVPNSGRGLWSKGDAIDGSWVIDYKEVSEKFVFNESVWAKICTDALNTGTSMEPLLKIVIGTANDKTRLGICDWNVFEFFAKDMPYAHLEINKSYKIVGYPGYARRLTTSNGADVAVLLWSDLRSLVPLHDAQRRSGPA